MNTLRDTDEGRARPSVWPVYLAAAIIGLVSLFVPLVLILLLLRDDNAADLVFTVFGVIGGPLVMAPVAILASVGLIMLRLWGWVCGLLWATVFAVTLGVGTVFETMDFINDSPQGLLTLDQVQTVSVSTTVGLAILALVVWPLATRYRLFYPPGGQKEKKVASSTTVTRRPSKLDRLIDPWLILLATMLSLLLLAVLSNPLLLIVMTRFEVVNESGVDLWITPIGMWEGTEGTGGYGPLLIFCNRFPPAIPRAWFSHDLPVKSGKSRTVMYENDDVNVRHILVRTEAGDLFIVDTDSEKDKYEIPPLASLPKAPSELLPCAEGEYVTYSGAVEYR